MFGDHQDLFSFHPNLRHRAQEAYDPLPDCIAADVIHACSVVEYGVRVVVREVVTGVICAVDPGCAVLKEVECGAGACVWVVGAVVFEVGILCDFIGRVG